MSTGLRFLRRGLFRQDRLWTFFRFSDRFLRQQVPYNRLEFISIYFAHEADCTPRNLPLPHDFDYPARQAKGRESNPRPLTSPVIARVSLDFNGSGRPKPCRSSGTPLCCFTSAGRGSTPLPAFLDVNFHSREEHVMTPSEELLETLKSIDHNLQHLLRHAKSFFALKQIPPVPEPEPPKSPKRPGIR
jgi:hypothetical protein